MSWWICVGKQSYKDVHPEGSKTGYSNNFGKPLDGGCTVEDQLVSQTSRLLVTKFIDITKATKVHDNIVSKLQRHD